MTPQHRLYQHQRYDAVTPAASRACTSAAANACACSAVSASVSDHQTLSLRQQQRLKHPSPPMRHSCPWPLQHRQATPTRPHLLQSVFGNCIPISTHPFIFLFCWQQPRVSTFIANDIALSITHQSIANVISIIPLLKPTNNHIISISFMFSFFRVGREDRRHPCSSHIARVQRRFRSSAHLSVCSKLKQQDCILQCHSGVMRSPSWRHHPASDALRLKFSFKPVLCICI